MGVPLGATANGGRMDGSRTRQRDPASDSRLTKVVLPLAKQPVTRNAPDTRRLWKHAFGNPGPSAPLPTPGNTTVVPSTPGPARRDRAMGLGQQACNRSRRRRRRSHTQMFRAPRMRAKLQHA